MLTINRINFLSGKTIMAWTLHLSTSNKRKEKTNDSEKANLISFVSAVPLGKINMNKEGENK